MQPTALKSEIRICKYLISQRLNTTANVRWPTSAIQKSKYSSTKIININIKIFISVQKYLFQYKNIYFSTKKYMSIQKYLFQYQNIYFNPKYLFQYKKKFSKKYKHIPSVFATRRQNGNESFKMADLNGYSKRSNHLLF